MKNFAKYRWPLMAIAVSAVVSLSIVRCGSDNASNLNYVQIERLGRPAINEALVRTNANLLAFNSVPPSADLTSTAAAVVAEAAVTLKALYAGACLVNGALFDSGLGSVQLTPAGMTCSLRGAGILNANLIGLNPTFDAEAGVYANRVAGQFLPDVLRIDTVLTSKYGGGASLCSPTAANGVPLLCGGRTLTDNVMDVTYAYLLNGEADPSKVSSIRNGVYYTPGTTTVPAPDVTCTKVPGGLGTGGFGANACKNPQGTNSRQGHGTVSVTMPFSPTPI